jgi:hypothetical protein
MSDEATYLVWQATTSEKPTPNPDVLHLDFYMIQLFIGAVKVVVSLGSPSAKSNPASSRHFVTWQISKPDDRKFFQQMSKKATSKKLAILTGLPVLTLQSRRSEALERAL